MESPRTDSSPTGSKLGSASELGPKSTQSRLPVVEDSDSACGELAQPGGTNPDPSYSGKRLLVELEEKRSELLHAEAEMERKESEFLRAKSELQYEYLLDLQQDLLRLKDKVLRLLKEIIPLRLRLKERLEAEIKDLEDVQTAVAKELVQKRGLLAATSSLALVELRKQVDMDRVPVKGSQGIFSSRLQEFLGLGQTWKESGESSDSPPGPRCPPISGQKRLIEEGYVYKPLKENQIRLLEILPGTPSDLVSCRLHHIYLQDVPKYRGVSYAWGEDTSTLTILVNQKALSIRCNLEAALREFRRNPPWAIPEMGFPQLMKACESCTELVGSFQNRLRTKSVSDESVQEFNELVKWTEARLYPVLHRYEEIVEGRLGVYSNYDEAIQSENATCAEYAKEWEEQWNKIARREGLNLLYQDPQFLWIDGICINQEDPEERSKQVPLMDVIYLNATSLVIWLGEETISSKTAFETLSAYFKDPQCGKKTLAQWIQTERLFGNKLVLYRCVLELLARPWFSRSWIVQEYILVGLHPQVKRPLSVSSRLTDNGGDIIVCCGPARSPCLVEKLFTTTVFHGDQDHEMLQGLFSNMEDSLIAAIGLGITNGGRLKAMRADHRRHIIDTKERPRLSNPKERTTSAAKAFRLLSAVAKCCPLGATNERDKIYSVLGLVESYSDEGEAGEEIPGALIIDYSATVQDVYSSFVQEVVQATKKLDVFGFCTGRTEIVLRTWTPDWTAFQGLPAQPNGILAQFHTWQDPKIRIMELTVDASQGSECDAKFSKDLSTTTVTGFIFDEIVQTLPKIHLAKYMEDEFKATCEGMLKLALYFKGGESMATLSSLVECLVLGCDKRSQATAPLQSVVTHFVDWITSESSSGSLEESTESEGKSHLDPTQLKFDLEGGILRYKEKPWSPLDPSVFALDMMTKYPGTTISLTKYGSFARPLSNAVEAGDLICVLLGCIMPMVLRPVGDHYELFGEAYVPGIMKGEAMVELHEGKRQLQEFELY